MELFSAILELNVAITIICFVIILLGWITALIVFGISKLLNFVFNLIDKFKQFNLYMDP